MIPKLAYILSLAILIQNKWVTMASGDIFLPLFVRAAQTGTSCEKQEGNLNGCCHFSGVCCFCSFTNVLAAESSLWLELNVYLRHSDVSPVVLLAHDVTKGRERERCVRVSWLFTSVLFFPLHQIKHLLFQNGVSLECRGCCTLHACIILLILMRWLSLKQPVSAINKSPRLVS